MIMFVFNKAGFSDLEQDKSNREAIICEKFHLKMLLVAIRSRIETKLGMVRIVSLMTLNSALKNGSHVECVLSK